MKERQQEQSIATNTVTTSLAGDPENKSQDQSAQSYDFHGVLDASGVFTTYNVPEYPIVLTDSLIIPNPEQQEPFFNGEILDKPREENKKESP